MYAVPWTFLTPTIDADDQHEIMERLSAFLGKCMLAGTIMVSHVLDALVTWYVGKGLYFGVRRDKEDSLERIVYSA